MGVRRSLGRWSLVVVEVWEFAVRSVVGRWLLLKCGSSWFVRSLVVVEVWEFVGEVWCSLFVVRCRRSSSFVVEVWVVVCGCGLVVRSLLTLDCALVVCFEMWRRRCLLVGYGHSSQLV